VKDAFAKLLAGLPLKKLTRNQAFDLSCDVVMVLLVLPGLAIDLGVHQVWLKPFMILYALGFITWSLAVNR
jgi:hypothetical protein